MIWSQFPIEPKKFVVFHPPPPAEMTKRFQTIEYFESEKISNRRARRPEYQCHGRSKLVCVPIIRRLC